jgi:hypothetical protein
MIKRFMESQPTNTALLTNCGTSWAKFTATRLKDFKAAMTVSKMRSNWIRPHHAPRNSGGTSTVGGPDTYDKAIAT